MTHQRQFTRLPFRSTSTLAPPTVPGKAAGPETPTELIDISLKGALVARPAGVAPAVGDALTLTVTVDDSPVVITMQVTVAHVTDDRIGLHCTAIDVESMTHLRRLMELNLGDPGLLDRELLHLG